MRFPSEKNIANAKARLSKRQGFLMLRPGADELEKFRFRLCQELLRYAQDHEMTSVAMAKLLGIPKADMSRIFNHRITRFSTDRLLKLYAKIYPDYRLKVA